MSKTRLWREASLLLLPVLALGGVAWWINVGPGRESREPFRLVVQGVERQTATARDVGEGFDTRFVVSLGHRGRTPQHWGERTGSIIFGKPRCLRSKRREWDTWSQSRVASRSLDFDAARNAYVMTFAARMTDVAPREGEVRLKLAIAAWSNDNSNVPQSDAIPKTDFEFTARRRGEKIKVPQVSRRSPLQARSVSVRYSSDERDKRPISLVSVRLLFRPLPQVNGKTPRLHRIGDDYFEDEHGQRTPTRPSWTSSSIGSDEFEHFFDISKLPKAQRLTFHARVSLDESWPADIRAVLWDKTRQPAKS